MIAMTRNSLSCLWGQRTSLLKGLRQEGEPLQGGRGLLPRAPYWRTVSFGLKAVECAGASLDVSLGVADLEERLELRHAAYWRTASFGLKVVEFARAHLDASPEVAEARERLEPLLPEHPHRVALDEPA